MKSLVLAIAAGAALVAGAGSARAAAGDVTSRVSSNWAGYAVTAPGGEATATFSAVSGSWTQSAASCTSPGSAYAAFWVGLGGFSDGSEALEQAGTETDCLTGVPRYSVWYELVPAAPVHVKLVVRPGDAISASVAVNGTTVTVRVRNATRRTVFTKKLSMAAPEVSSAEWIVEAPSACSTFGCRPLPLTNFGTVTFTDTTAVAGGHAGTISDPAWAATALTLQGASAEGFRGRFASAFPVANAVPGDVSGDGSSFAVSWQDATGALPR